MKKMATVITAASLAAVSVASSAAGWGDVNSADRYYGSDAYRFAPYPSAPYGYAMPVGPVAPGVELTEEQKQAFAEQQAKAIEYMQNAQKQAAEYYAGMRSPMLDMHKTMMEEREARFKEMQARREAALKAYEARVAEADKAYEARRKEREAENGMMSYEERRKAREEAYKARLERYHGKQAADSGA